MHAGQGVSPLPLGIAKSAVLLPISYHAQIAQGEKPTSCVFYLAGREAGRQGGRQAGRPADRQVNTRAGGPSPGAQHHANTTHTTKQTYKKTSSPTYLAPSLIKAQPEISRKEDPRAGSPG